MRQHHPSVTRRGGFSVYGGASIDVSQAASLNTDAGLDEGSNTDSCDQPGTDMSDRIDAGALFPPDPCIPRCATYCSGKDTSDTTCICYCH